MSTRIHSTAIIDPAAKLGADVKIGPYCVIEGPVELGDGVELKAHVCVAGRTKIGSGTTIFPFASIGHAPQDLKYHGEESELVIGANCKIREHVTMNPGTEGGGMITRVGDNCLFMMGSHVAHDCIVGNNVILANNATLAGHVTVGEHVILGGLSAVLQWVRIGAHAIIGGLAGVENDVIPYGMVKGDRAHLYGLNLVGLQRRNFPEDDIKALRQAYKTLFAHEGTMAERTAEVADTYANNKTVMTVVDFIRSKANNPLCQPLH